MLCAWRGSQLELENGHNAVDKHDEESIETNDDSGDGDGDDDDDGDVCVGRALCRGTVQDV